MTAFTMQCRSRRWSMSSTRHRKSPMHLYRRDAVTDISAESLAASARDALLEKIGIAGTAERFAWVERVTLHQSQAEVKLVLPGPKPIRMGRSVPMAIKQRGPERRVVITPAGDTRRSADPRLIRALTLAFRFWEQLSSELPKSAQEFAMAEGVDERFLGRSLPLEFLAPEIVQTIAEGRQATSATAEKLLRWKALPISWEKQRAAVESLN